MKKIDWKKMSTKELAVSFEFNNSYSSMQKLKILISNMEFNMEKMLKNHAEKYEKLKFSKTEWMNFHVYANKEKEKRIFVCKFYTTEDNVVIFDISPNKLSLVKGLEFQKINDRLKKFLTFVTGNFLPIATEQMNKFCNKWESKNKVS